MKKLKIQKIISFLLIVFLIPTPSFARYYDNLGKFSTKASIAEPIINVETLQETVVSDFNKTTVKEYHFKITNYELETNGNKRISEVDFNYTIEIKNSSNNFPAKYELYDCSTNLEILNGASKTQEFYISKNNMYEKEYKIIVSWEDKDELASQNDINIMVNASQKK